MSLITCKECGKEVSDQALSCPHCGSPVKDTSKMFCMHCGELIDKDCIVCPKCGKQVKNIATQEKERNIIVNNSNIATANATNHGHMREKNKWVSFVLCLFLGFLGIHKFYEGKIIMGVLYIFTLGFWGIGCLVDLIVILCKPHYYY